MSDILIVDDSIANLQLLEDVLKAQGHRTRLATDGRQGLEEVGNKPPDLILLDVSMPVMTGYEVCQRLQADPALQDIPVIFLSGMSGALDKVRAFQAGGVDYITRPFEVEEVLARVRMQLQLGEQKTALQENYERLKELERLRDNLVHMLVHDLRSSLTGLRLALDLIGDREPAEAAKADLFQKAQSCVGRLIQMTDQLLEISRLESGQMPLHRQTADLAKTVHTAIESLAALAGESRFRVTSMASVHVVHDTDIIRRVIENLVCNALKFSPSGAEVELTVTCEQGLARVAVTDRGPGIPAEAHKRIFEKFAQINPLNRRLGAGLGLTFCKLAVEAHGGQIGVSSEPGKGSTFWFTLQAEP